MWRLWKIRIVPDRPVILAEGGGGRPTEVTRLSLAAQ